MKLEDGTRVKTSPAKIRLAEDGANPWYEVILIEGLNRQIRRMFQSVGFWWKKSSACNWDRCFGCASGKIPPFNSEGSGEIERSVE